MPLWKNYGLTTIYITVHDTDKKNNAIIYGVKDYPDLEIILSRIHSAELSARANLVLSKRSIGTSEKFALIIRDLKNMGFYCVSVWPIRDRDDIKKDSRVLYRTNKKLALFPDGTLSGS